MGELILVADDDTDIREFIELNLTLEGFEVISARDGEQAVRVARERGPALAILDVMMPKMDGVEACRILRSDARTASISIIMLTAKTLSSDRLLGLTAGADDYISKPFDPAELVARVRTTLRRASELRSISPLTGLPGNIQVESEIAKRFTAGEKMAILWLDLDSFKAFNDRYGFIRGDKAIGYLADVLRTVTADLPDIFIGHIGGDDFVVICPPAVAEELAEAIVRRFDRDVASLYDPADAEAGSIKVTDRRGEVRDVPLLTLSIGAATNADHEYGDYRALVEVATEMKSYAKEQPGSVVAIDRRSDDA
jgi:diguanylate cyclase (GGDEF)-like protein